MRRLLLALVVLLAPAIASAQASVHAIAPAGGGGVVLLNDIALNAAAGVRTFTINNSTQLKPRGFSYLVLSVKRTRNAGTDLTMTCTQSPDGGATDYMLAECEGAAASGVCNFYQQTWQDEGDVSANWTWRVDVLGYSHLECVFGSTSASASDKLTVTGTLVTQ